MMKSAFGCLRRCASWLATLWCTARTLRNAIGVFWQTLHHIPTSKKRSKAFWRTAIKRKLIAHLPHWRLRGIWAASAQEDGDDLTPRIIVGIIGGLWFDVCVVGCCEHDGYSVVQAGTTSSRRLACHP